MAVTASPVTLTPVSTSSAGFATGSVVGSSVAGSSSVSQTQPSTTHSPPSSAPAPNGVWQPTIGTSWQIILSEQIKFDSNGGVTPNVDIYDLDLFDTPASTISKLHEAGKKVICYFSAGSYEDWRPDKESWTALGSNLAEWAGELWADVRTENVRNIMKERIALAASKGCDGIDPDNVDAFDNQNGLSLNAADAADFVKFLAVEAAKYNMATGLKNSAAIVPDVLPYVQYSVNKQCGQIGECDLFAPMTQAGKPVYNIEYPPNGPSLSEADSESMCQAATTYNFSTVLKKMNLDGWVKYCGNSTLTG